MNKLRLNAGSPIFTGIAAVVFGVIMVAWPATVVKSILVVIGWLLIAIGGLPILYSLIRKFPVSFIAVIYLICGILVLVFKEVFVNVVMWIFGIILVLGAIQQFNIISGAKKMGYTPKAYTYVYSGILLLAGIVALINPFASMETLVMFFGCGLLFYGVTLLLSEFSIQHARGKGSDYTIKE